MRGRALVAATLVVLVAGLTLIVIVPDGGLPNASKIGVVNTLAVAVLIAERFLTRPPGGPPDGATP